MGTKIDSFLQFSIFPHILNCLWQDCAFHKVFEDFHMLSNEQNDEECDTTGDAMKNYSRQQNKNILL